MGDFRNALSGLASVDVMTSSAWHKDLNIVIFFTPRVEDLEMFLSQKLLQGYCLQDLDVQMKSRLIVCLGITTEDKLISIGFNNVHNTNCRWGPLRIYSTSTGKTWLAFEELDCINAVTSRRTVCFNDRKALCWQENSAQL